MANATPVHVTEEAPKVPAVPKRAPKKAGKLEEMPTIMADSPAGTTYKLPDGTIVHHN